MKARKTEKKTASTLDRTSLRESRFYGIHLLRTQINEYYSRGNNNPALKTSARRHMPEKHNVKTENQNHRDPTFQQQPP